MGGLATTSATTQIPIEAGHTNRNNIIVQTLGYSVKLILSDKKALTCYISTKSDFIDGK